MQLRTWISALSLWLLSASSALAMNYKISEATSLTGSKINVVHLTGEIVIGEWALWKQMVFKLNLKRDTLLVISSPGGNAAHGLFLLNHVDEFLRTQYNAGYEVAIMATRDCSSMCVPFYYSFPIRFAKEDTRFGLHAVHDEMGANSEFTKQYLNRLFETAQVRGDRNTIRWLNEKMAAGVFASSELDVNRAGDLAITNGGLVTESSIVDSESLAMKRITPQVNIQGTDLSWTHPEYRSVIRSLWTYVARDLAQVDLHQVEPPVLHLEPFDRAEQSATFTLWQNEWIINNISVWLEWTEIKGISKEKVTPEWVRERISEIYPFSENFSGNAL